MALPAQWYVVTLGVVKKFVWELVKRIAEHKPKKLAWEAVRKVAEHRFCHLVYQYGCVWCGRKMLGWFREKVWPSAEIALLGPRLILLKVPVPVRVTELDPRVLRIWYELYKRQ